VLALRAVVRAKRGGETLMGSRHQEKSFSAGFWGSDFLVFQTADEMRWRNALFMPVWHRQL